MPMNIVIQEQRKQLGLTQEQVADYLGVSTPAVSKWEKGITSPDIGLLPPLARLLKIDLNTLFCFSEDLSAEEIGFFCNELAKQARENILSAFDVAEAKIHDYPHNEQLLLNVTIILDSLLLQTADDAFPIDNLDTKILGWYLQLAESNDEKIRNSANYMRVSRYIRQGNTDAAQEVLDTIQDKTDLISALPDKLMLQVSVYLQQHKSELAALELEKALFKEITRVQMLLTKLVDAELASGNTEFACKIAEKASAITGIGIIVHVSLKHMNFIDSLFCCFDTVRQFIKSCFQLLHMSNQIFVVIQAAFFQEQINLGKFFSIELLCPMSIAFGLAICQSLLNVNEHTETLLGMNLLACVFCLVQAFTGDNGYQLVL